MAGFSGVLRHVFPAGRLVPLGFLLAGFSGASGAAVNSRVTSFSALKELLQLLLTSSLLLFEVSMMNR